MPGSVTTQVPGQLTYLDRPEISETYADSVAKLYFEGGTLKIEFTVNRMDKATPPDPVTGKAVTAARLVLPIHAMFALHQQLGGLIQTLQQSGQVQVATAPGQPPERVN